VRRGEGNTQQGRKKKKKESLPLQTTNGESNAGYTAWFCGGEPIISNAEVREGEPEGRAEATRVSRKNDRSKLPGPRRIFPATGKSPNHREQKFSEKEKKTVSRTVEEGPGKKRLEKGRRTREEIGTKTSRALLERGGGRGNRLTFRYEAQAFVGPQQRRR